MPLKLHNTLTRQLEALRPTDPALVTFYTCGPTVYDDAHIGNFRSFLAADVLRRFIESPLCDLETRQGGVHRPTPEAPRRVVHVMNITDVGHMTDDDQADGGGEDKMAVAGRRIAEAKKSGKLPPGAEINPNDPRQIASFYAGRFIEDAKRLGLKVAIESERDPSLMPRATASIEGMKLVIERLLAHGHAYIAGTPGRRAIYFDVTTFADYGRLSGNTLDALKEGAGGRISEGNQSEKRSAADFLLWKEDASHVMKWPSPSGAGGGSGGLGEGYPGWHIECSVMSAARLAGSASRTGRALSLDELANLMLPAGAPIIDLHSGGEDNIFPHHECEMAQSCCAFNLHAPGTAGSGSFAGMWFHPRFLFVEGAKMSKSKGNFFTARDLFARGIEPGALRLELIRTHYRSNANFTDQGLKDSQRMLERWRRVLSGEKASDTPSATSQNADNARGTCREAVRVALMDDLNIAGALGEINAWAGGVERPGPEDARLMRELDAILGVLSLEQATQATTDIGVFIGCPADASVIAKLQERVEAKKGKDFKRSDAIRDELAALGFAIKDVAGGKVEVRRAGGAG